jgi:hypothetical protein
VSTAIGTNFAVRGSGSSIQPSNGSRLPNSHLCLEVVSHPLLKSVPHNPECLERHRSGFVVRNSVAAGSRLDFDQHLLPTESHITSSLSHALATRNSLAVAASWKNPPDALKTWQCVSLFDRSRQSQTPKRSRIKSLTRLQSTKIS